jgi:signal transduction histidine kinase
MEGTGRVGQEFSSPREAEAQARALARLRRQRATLRPFGIAITVGVILGAFSGHPRPGLHGTALGISLALVVFAAMMALALRDWFISLSYPAQGAAIALMGAAGIALSSLQPRDATELAAGASVWLAVARLPVVGGVALGAAITVGLDVAMALAGSSGAAAIASTLLCALLGLIAHFMKQARASQDRTELLLAQLEDARDEQAQAAAVAERSRIAGELHDVLAHSLSGAAIQLQGARILADRGDAPPQVSEAIDRASELVRDGLSEARQAVGALRGEKLPGVDELEKLVSSFRQDMHLDVELIVDGVLPQLPAEASLALYRGAQEALTNVARYAPGARTEVRLCTAAARAVLTIEDHVTARSEAAEAAGLTGVGGGRGLSAMRERVERIGGTASAGPTESGWRVELEVPA